MKIRVTYLIKDMIRGGTETVLCDVVNGLDPALFEPTLVTLDWGCEFKLAPHVRLIELGRTNTRRQGAARRAVLPGLRAALVLGERFWRTLRTIQNLRPHVLHTHLRQADFYGQVIGALGIAPIVYTMIHSTVEWPRPARTPMERIEDALLSVPRRITAVSRHLRDYVVERRHVDASRVAVLHSGVRVDRFAESAARRAEARRKLGYLPSDRVIVCVAQFRPEKRHDLLLEAMATVARAAPRALLLMAGSNGGCRENLVATVRRLGLEQRVRLVPADRDDLQDILAAGDVFTMQSKAEGGPPVAMLEAIASGLPVVVPNHSPFTDAAREGLEGRLFRWGDTGDHARRMLQMLDDVDRGNRFWNDSARWVRERFSVATHIDGLTRMYLEDVPRLT